MEFLLIAVVAVAVGVGYKLLTRDSAGDVQPPAWWHDDLEPEDKPGHDRTPDSVQHELDLENWRYKVLTTWINDDIAAESDSSVVRESFDVRRTADGDWQIRLAERNFSKLEGRGWQPAPERFVRQWEAARVRVGAKSPAEV